MCCTVATAAAPQSLSQSHKRTINLQLQEIGKLSAMKWKLYIFFFSPSLKRNTVSQQPSAAENYIVPLHLCVDRERTELKERSTFMTKHGVN